ncbi:MAG TPA: ATP-grasp domain-containing protein [Kineosporiaceae bacterium]|nr:ATP-grasp domain-containing protein [Kineosporiaceae bacterium]
MIRHVLIVGNGRELPAHVHQVDAQTQTSVLVRSGVLKRVRDASLHARIVGLSATEDAAWIDMAKAIHGVQPITHVASFSEKDQDKAAAVASALQLRMHSPETVRAVHDKLHMRERLASAGLPGPVAELITAASDITAFAARHGYPVVVKPVMGAASAGVTVVSDPTQAEAAWNWGAAAGDAADDRLMVESFLAGPEISVEAFSERGEHLVVAVTVKVKDPTHCVELGHMIRGELPAETEIQIRQVVTDLLRALDVQDGLTHTELILTDAGPMLVETHLRPAGDLIPETIRDTYGLDLLDFLVRQSLGEQVIDRIRSGCQDLQASDQYPAIWYRVPDRSGLVTAVDGLAEARAVPGVLSVELELEVGTDVVDVLRDSRDRLLVVRAISDSPAHALEIARAAAEMVTVTITPGEPPRQPLTEGAPMSETGDATVENSYEFPGLHHVQLAIPPGGEDLARRYYGEILGMTELEKPPVLAARGGCWFRSTGLEIHLGVEKDFRAAAKAHPGILVKDLDALAKRLEAAGAGVEWDDNFPGHRRFYSHDLHGNRIELLEPKG